MLTNQQKDQIITLSTIEKKNNTQIARLMGVSRGSIIKVIKSGWSLNQQFLDTYNKNVQENNDKLLDMIKSVRYSDIVKDGLSMFNKENMQTEFELRGLRSIIALVGNSFDKGMAYEKLDLDKRKVELQERTLELKEQELQARLENPEAFTTVTIIDDSDKVNEWYAKHGTDKPYINN